MSTEHTAFVSAICELVPDAVFSLQWDDNNGSYMLWWLDERTKPTDAEITAKIAEMEGGQT